MKFANSTSEMEQLLPDFGQSYSSIYLFTSEEKVRFPENWYHTHYSSVVSIEGSWNNIWTAREQWFESKKFAHWEIWMLWALYWWVFIFLATTNTVRVYDSRALNLSSQCIEQVESSFCIILQPKKRSFPDPWILSSLNCFENWPVEHFIFAAASVKKMSSRVMITTRRILISL